ncbi:uncharacterized protein RAG0_14446 [Rhynchosporium agropyri]|uniref:Uncharacterized protein n=1 Tax=Rhynchosporium agropyri TaxID=914238 RepID=A0A1E1LH45_9HELO|nr:uncharacterized protein RAG0_14446 [Rhynchosporium agropyri]
MHFNTISIFGLVAIASAAPHTHTRSEKEVGAPAARGIHSRSIVARSNDNYVTNFASGFDSQIIIQHQTVTILNVVNTQQMIDAQREAEFLFIQAIQQQLLAQQQLQFAIDNIRINTFLKANPPVNTVAIIVTQVNDNRDVNNRNVRYYTRQIQSNPSASQQIFVVVNESSQMNIGRSDQGPIPGFAGPQFASYTPGDNASFQPSGINLFPFGVASPQFANSRNFVDPALIIQPTQGLFVASQNQQQSNAIVVV